MWLSPRALEFQSQWLESKADSRPCLAECAWAIPFLSLGLSFPICKIRKWRRSKVFNPSFGAEAFLAMKTFQGFVSRSLAYKAALHPQWAPALLSSNSAPEPAWGGAGNPWRPWAWAGAGCPKRPSLGSQPTANSLQGCPAVHLCLQRRPGLSPGRPSPSGLRYPSPTSQASAGPAEEGLPQSWSCQSESPQGPSDNSINSKVI